MRQLILAAAFVAVSATAFAQGVTVRFYVVPKVGTGANPHDAQRPKYIADWPIDHPGDAVIPFSAMDYGMEDTFLVGASVTADQHTALAANLDVIAMPPLDDLIGLTALTTVQQKLDGLHIPSDWVTTQHTYRDVVRVVGKLFLFMQRFSGRQVRVFFESGITLDTRLNQLTQAQRTALQDTAVDLGLDTSILTGPMTIRQALKTLADQMPPFALAGDGF